MRRTFLTTLGLCLLVVLTGAWWTDGPLTNFMNLRGRTDENGYLRISIGTTGLTDGPLTAMGQLRARTDENGYLRVSLASGSVPPCGSDTQVQFNDGGACGASSSFTFNKTTTVHTTPNLTVSGNRSLSAWTTAGAGLVLAGNTYTDTSSSGTVALQGVHAIAAPTLVASAATTFTDSAAFYLAGPPTASTNVTQTNAWTLYVSGQSIYTSPFVLGATTASAGGSRVSTDGLYLYTSSSSALLRGIANAAEFTGSGNSSSAMTGILSHATTSAASTGNLTASTNGGGLVGAFGRIFHAGSGTVTMATAVNGFIRTSNSTGGITDAADMQAVSPTVSTGTTLTNFYGFWARGGSISGTITTRYGLRIDDLTGGTTRYGIYQAGATDLNLFAGPTTFSDHVTVEGVAATGATGTGKFVFDTGSTPTSMTLTNATGLPIATGVANLAANIATFLTTPSSANLIAAVTDETGTGSLVFSISPTFTGTVGAADATATGTVRANTSFNANGSAGESTTCTAITSVTFTFGLLTGHTCTSPTLFVEAIVLRGLQALGYDVLTHDEAAELRGLLAERRTQHAAGLSQ